MFDKQHRPQVVGGAPRASATDLLFIGPRMSALPREENLNSLRSKFVLARAGTGCGTHTGSMLLKRGAELTWSLDNRCHLPVSTESTYLHSDGVKRGRDEADKICGHW